LNDGLDPARQNVAKLLQDAGLPDRVRREVAPEVRSSGFDYWIMLPGQGCIMIRHDRDGAEEAVAGIRHDLITDYSLDYLKRRKKDRPFFLMCHHKARIVPGSPTPGTPTSTRAKRFPSRRILRPLRAPLEGPANATLKSART